MGGWNAAADSFASRREEPPSPHHHPPSPHPASSHPFTSQMSRLKHALYLTSPAHAPRRAHMFYLASSILSSKSYQTPRASNYSTKQKGEIVFTLHPHPPQAPAKMRKARRQSLSSASSAGGLSGLAAFASPCRGIQLRQHHDSLPQP